VKHLRLLFQVSLTINFVSLLLGFTENDCPAVTTTIQVDDISNNSITRIIRAADT
jgi:hypothetical protein